MDWFTLTTEVLAKKKQENISEPEPSTSSDEDLDVEKVEGRFIFSPLEAAGLACILEEASTELYIIDMGTSVSSPHSSNIIARKKVIDVIEETREEIECNQTCDVLYKRAKEEAESRREAKLLRKSFKKNQFRLEDLKAKLKGQEFAKLKDMNKKQEIIASLKDEIHEEIIKNDVKIRYIDRLEASKQGQNRMRCQIAESDLEEKLEQITSKSNNEIRVHDEICAFLALEEKDLLKQVEKWKETYEKEMKSRIDKIKLLQTRMKEQQILHHNLLELYHEREKEINSYLLLKEKIRQEEEHNRLINEKAIKIQAWWRGTMVRRGLGPFKKKKKPAKEKKKN